jgi:hypothetical protein
MATITKGKTFASGEVVTPQKMHDMVDLATVAGIVNADISATAAIAASKLASTLDLSSNTVTLPNTSVTAAMLASNSVEEAKIASNAVTSAKIASAAVTPAKLSQPLTVGTSQATTSGTEIDFTGIPSWANRITLMFDGVSLSEATTMTILIGDSGGIESSGYISSGSRLSATAVSTFGSLGAFTFNGPANAGVGCNGHFVLTRLTGNAWAASGVVGTGLSTPIVCVTAGAKTLSATLDRVRITSTSGTATFDAGTINVMYEG